MADYSKATNFAVKDGLPSGNPAKIVKGTEIDVEFNAIQTSNSTKADKTGTLAQFAATTSAQLAGVVSDETGSGALVFATSPTLVTPILGTPTSGTLTNCTFPTFNQNTTGSSGSCTGNSATATTAGNVSGTVAVANGGTGLTSSGTSGNVLTSNGSTWISSAPAGGGVTSVTGTAPVVSSGGTTPAISIPAATASVAGYMTAAYASKLDGIASGATVGVPKDVGYDAVGAICMAGNTTSPGTLASGATIAGGSIKPYSSQNTIVSYGSVLTGTWRNIGPTINNNVDWVSTMQRIV